MLKLLPSPYGDARLKWVKSFILSQSVFSAVHCRASEISGGRVTFLKSLARLASYISKIWPSLLVMCWSFKNCNKTGFQFLCVVWRKRKMAHGKTVKYILVQRFFFILGCITRLLKVLKTQHSSISFQSGPPPPFLSGSKLVFTYRKHEQSPQMGRTRRKVVLLLPSSAKFDRGYKTILTLDPGYKCHSSA